MDRLRDEILKKLAKPPYRFTSKQVFEALPPEVFAGVEFRWKMVEEELAAMREEHLLHVQNGCFIRWDRMRRKPPERRKSPRKIDPRQKGFGFE